MSNLRTAPAPCPVATDPIRLKDRLQKAGLRVTRQRLALGRLLFNGKHQHITAEKLHQRAIGAKAHLTLATVYNTLHQFKAAGLLREVAVSASTNYFDTDYLRPLSLFHRRRPGRGRHAACIGLTRQHSGSPQRHGSHPYRRDRPCQTDRFRLPRGLGCCPLARSLPQHQTR
ncbi:transcriptional repressor [Breoghania sp.]|uniref:Fur family transcriptional regulator n=1 Tax=Breoghania sp. TaxID=2065378 RepID=UPI002602414A|nr:transcriptional repressor [Breoghania sp.]MDJ0933243.1 transcriptional repressor [Breoghania sp.]